MSAGHEDYRNFRLLNSDALKLNLRTKRKTKTLTINIIAYCVFSCLSVIQLNIMPTHGQMFILYVCLLNIYMAPSKKRERNL